VLRLILLDLARRRLRTVIAASGIAVGVAAVVALLALGTGIERGAAGLARLGGAELGLFQAGRGDLTASRLPRSLAEEARRQPGVEDAAPVLVLTEPLAGEESFLLFGVDPSSFVMSRLVFTGGGPPSGPGEIVLGDAAARELELTTGDGLELGDTGYRVVGVYHAGVPFEDQGAALPLAVAQALSASGEDATTIAVSVEPGVRADEVGSTLEDAFPGTLAITEPGQVSRVDTNALLIDKATVVLTVLALLVGAIVVMNTALMTVLERQRDFALLIAVGWPARRVVELVVGQAVLLGVLGAAIGIPLGVVAGELATGLVGSSALVDPAVSAGTLAVAFAVSVGMGVLGGAYPAWRVTRLRPAQALG
jgi:putative ABC transport system permease protein